MKFEMTNSHSESLLLINSLVGQLSQNAKEISQMRTDLRYELNTKVLIGSKDGDNQFVCDYESWGIDISNNGIGLLVTKSQSIGKMYYMAMRPADEDYMFALVKVRTCDKLTCDIYKIGAIFVWEDHVSPPRSQLVA